MKKEFNVSKSNKEITEVLQSIIEWWDRWIISENPTELEEPPIELARKLLKEHGTEIKSH